MMKVKIVKCSEDTYWYANKIGCVYDVEEYSGRWRIIENGCSTATFLLKEDCKEIIENQHLDEYHYHEMIDRINNVQHIVASLLEGHPCSPLVEKYLEKAQKQLGKAYQKMGSLRDERFGEE